jgi:hypothetical protein
MPELVADLSNEVQIMARLGPNETEQIRKVYSSSEGSKRAVRPEDLFSDPRIVDKIVL